MNARLICVPFLVILLTASCSIADEINFEIFTVGSGTLGDVEFNDQLITISGVGDTDNVEMVGAANLLLEGIVVTVDIEGLAPATFTDAVQAVSNNGSMLGGFGNATNDQGLLFISNDAFSTYDLTTELGPISGQTFINIVPHETTAGNLILSSVSNVGTFQARFTAIPEPGGSLLVVMMAGVAMIRRHRSR